MRRPPYIPQAVTAIAAAVAVARWPLSTLLVLAGGTVIVLFRGQLARVAALLAGLGVLGCSWNAVKLGGVSAGDVLFIVALPLLLVHWATQTTGPRPRHQRWPPWLLVGAVTIAVAAMLVAINPPPAGYFTGRFEDQTGAGSLLVAASNTVSLLRFEAALFVVPVVLALSSWRGLVPARRFGDLWVLGIALSGLVSLTDKVGVTAISLRLGASSAAYTGRESGLTVTPNHLAVSLSLIVPVLMTWFTRSYRWRLAAACVGCIALGGLYVAGSAGATVASVLAVVLSFACLPQFRRHALKAAGAAILLVILVVGPLTALGTDVLKTTRIDRASASGGRESDLQRQILAEQARHDFATRPLQGIGLSQITSGHRAYLELLAATGLVGTIGYYVYVAGALNVAFRRRRQSSDPLLLGAAGVSLLSFLIEGLVENQLTDCYLYVSVGLILAAAGREARTFREPNPSPAPRSSARRAPVRQATPVGR